MVETAKTLTPLVAIMVFCFIGCFAITEYDRKACSKYGRPLSPPARVNTTTRLEALRKVMNSSVELYDQPIQAFLVTTDDDHQSEYTDEHDKRLKYISGFSGSAGSAIITLKEAALWTDGRYHLQADEELNCLWLLMREGLRNVSTKAQWLKKTLPSGSRIGADPKLISNSTWSSLEEALNREGANVTLVPLQSNPIDKIWVQGRPVKRFKDVFVWEQNFSGKSWQEKVEELREEFKTVGAQAMIVTALDEIAWLLNIRGRDIPRSPFVRSYVIVNELLVTLYVNQSQLTKYEVVKHLNLAPGISRQSIRIKDYEDVWTDLKDEAQRWTFIVPSSCVFSPGSSYAIYSLVPPEKQISIPSPIIFMKARKNEVEIKGMEYAHVRDAVAMCMFLSYFEKTFPGQDWTELQMVEMLDRVRYEQELSLGNSFNTIVAFGMNGAMPHYEPTYNTNTVVFDNSTIVIDSGGQYKDGTTDVTRTVHMGVPTPDEKVGYTRVLMGLIQLSLLVFPDDLPSSAADVMARAPLWEEGLDYRHGTGHGVGAFLGVHESPINLHYLGKNDYLLEPGYFISNEPGYYRGDFGVRLENVLEVIEKPWLKHGTGQRFFGFKDVTLVPFEPKLIDYSLLTSSHRKWLNEYNARIRRTVGAELKRQNRTEAFFWMMDKTKYIPENGQSRSSHSLTLILSNVALIKILHHVYIF